MNRIRYDYECRVLEAQAFINKAIEELMFIFPPSNDEEDRVQEVVSELEIVEEIVAGLTAEIQEFRSTGE